MHGFGAVAAGLAAAVALGACGSGRTELPTSVPPAPPLQAARVAATTLTTVATAPDPAADAGPETSLSDYKSPGEKHPLAGGTLAASYPRVGLRPPRGVAPAPDGQSWAALNVRFCAGSQDPISGDLVDPGRFRIEVPGQGLVEPAPGAPALAAAPLITGTVVVAGTCADGSIAFLVGGEGHVESTTYETGDGLLRWAT